MVGWRRSGSGRFGRNEGAQLMRAHRRVTSTAAPSLLVMLPATATPSGGSGAAAGGAAAGPDASAALPPAAIPTEQAVVPPAPSPAPLPTGAVPGAVPGVPGGVATGAPVGAGAYLGEVVDGIPAAALRAYRSAAATIGRQDPSCGLDWALLAGIGRVESNHGRYGGSVPDAGGVVRPAILGPVLTGGPGMARISDHDGGRLDGDATFDRAVGPMQFIPSTWQLSAADGDGDGVANPSDLDDA